MRRAAHLVPPPLGGSGHRGRMSPERERSAGLRALGVATFVAFLLFVASRRSLEGASA